MKLQPNNSIFLKFIFFKIKYNSIIAIIKLISDKKNTILNDIPNVVVVAKKDSLLEGIDLDNDYKSDFSGKFIQNLINLDLKRFIWNRKRIYWNKTINLVAPSNWIASCAKQSFLFKDQPIKVIPSAIDLNFWHPLDKKETNHSIKRYL